MNSQWKGNKRSFSHTFGNIYSYIQNAAFQRSIGGLRLVVNGIELLHNVWLKRRHNFENLQLIGYFEDDNSKK